MVLNFDDYLYNINEGLIKSYDINFVIDKSKQLLSIINTRISIEKNTNNSIKLTIFDFNKIIISEIFNLLNSNFVNLFGWFPSYMYLTNIVGMKNNMNYDEIFLKNTYEYISEVSIVYESKFDIESDIPDKLYHLSIKEYENKIINTGINPKSKSKLSSHGNRIYVCKSINDCEELISKMKFYFYNKNSKINPNWIIYEISTSGLNIKLYKDLNYPDKGYYLTSNIPPSSIKVIKEQ